jgi:hypothetical protein
MLAILCKENYFMLLSRTVSKPDTGLSADSEFEEMIMMNQRYGVCFLFLTFLFLKI